MSCRVEFRPEAEQDLANLDPQVAQRVLRKIKWLAENFELIAPEPLTGGWKGKFKLRVGDYRVIYTSDPSQKLITIHLIGHRRDIYK